MGLEFTVREYFAPVRIWRLHRLFERTQWMSADERRAVQDQLLRRTVRHAYDRVPFWRERFDRERLVPADIRTASDLVKLPALTRAEVRDAGERLHARGVRAVSQVTTSGSTGRPVTVRFDRRANALEFAYYWRHWGWAGYRLGHRFAQVAIEPFMSDPALCSRPWLWQPLLGRLLLNASALAPQNARAVLEALRRHRPRFIKGTFVQVYSLARLVSLTGATDVRVTATFSTAGHLPAAWRALVERTFGGQVLDGYGHLERCVAASQCPRGRYHVSEDYGVLELDEVKPRAPFGRPAGAVLGTSLHNRAMPLLRYEVGDLIEPAPPGETCPCGRTLPLVAAIAGRTEDVVITPAGLVVSGLYLVQNLVPGIETCQFVQEEPGRLRVRVVPGQEYSAASQEALRAVLDRLSGGSLVLTIETVAFDALERTAAGKIPAVISRLA